MMQQNRHISDIREPVNIRSLRLIGFAALVAVIGFGSVFAAQSILSVTKTEAAQDNVVNPLTVLQENMRELRRRVNLVESENDLLRQEIQKLTAQNGVLDRMIGHIKELKSQNNFVLQTLSAPLQVDMADGSDDPTPAATGQGSSAVHQVVTPVTRPTDKVQKGAADGPAAEE